MSERMTFLQRVALAAASERFPAAPRASAGMLTIGRLVRRRRIRLARLSSSQVEAGELLEPNAPMPQASTEPAPSASDPAFFAGRGEAARNARLPEMAATSPSPDPSPDGSAGAGGLGEGHPAISAASLPIDAGQSQASEARPAPAGVGSAAAGARAPAPPAPPATLAAPAVFRKRLQRDLTEGAPDEEEEKEPPVVARATSDLAAGASPGDEIEKEEEEQPSVQRALMAGPPPAAPGPIGHASPAGSSPVQAPLGPWMDRRAPTPQLDVFARNPAAPGAEEAVPSEAPAPAHTDGTAPDARREPPVQRGEPLSVPQPPAALPVAAEPVVHIGSIEIVIEAPAPEPRSAGTARAPAADLASRLYLRGL
jgi:hypothetical protein